jgi:hypothetical protein
MASLGKLTRFSNSVLGHIFLFWDLKDFARALPTCKGFQIFAQKVWQFSLTSHKISDQSALLLVNFANHTLVHLPNIPRNITAIINVMPHLNAVHSGHKKIQGQTLLEAALHSNKTSALTEVSTRMTPLKKNTLERISILCPNLIRVVFDRASNVIDRDTAHLANLKKLERVSITSAHKITRLTARTLATLPSIKSVSFYGCSGIKASAIADVLDAPLLTRLNVGGECGGPWICSRQQAIADVIIAKGGNLTDLVMCDAFYQAESLIAIADPKNCPKLTYLNLERCDEEFIPLSQRPQLAAKLRSINPHLEVVGLEEPKPAS